MSRIDDLLRYFPRSLGPCEVSMGGGRLCGEDGADIVLGKIVCEGHLESAGDVAAFIRSVMRRST